MTTTLVNLELIADWLKENVCPHLQYKRPNDDNNDGTYNYQLVNPDVHIMYIPSCGQPRQQPLFLPQ